MRDIPIKVGIKKTQKVVKLKNEKLAKFAKCKKPSKFKKIPKATQTLVVSAAKKENIKVC